MARSRLGLLNDRRFCLEDFWPVELDVGVLFFDRTDGRFVKRRPPNFHAGRRAKPVKHFVPRSALPANGVDKRGGFVPTLVAAKFQKWHCYLRLEDRAVRAGGLAAFEPPRFAGLAPFFFGVLLADRAGFEFTGSFGDGALKTERNRVSSPIQ